MPNGTDTNTPALFAETLRDGGPHSENKKKAVRDRLKSFNVHAHLTHVFTMFPFCGDALSMCLYLGCVKISSFSPLSRRTFLRYQFNTLPSSIIGVNHCTLKTHDGCCIVLIDKSLSHRKLKLQRNHMQTSTVEHHSNLCNVT